MSIDRKLPQNENELKALCMMATGAPKQLAAVKAVVEVLARANWRLGQYDGDEAVQYAASGISTDSLPIVIGKFEIRARPSVSLPSELTPGANMAVFGAGVDLYYNGEKLPSVKTTITIDPNDFVYVTAEMYVPPKVTT